MKKMIMTTALIGLIGFAGIQLASAHSYGGGYGYCGNYNGGYAALNDKDREAIEKFRSETSDIRKEIVVKRSELNALARQDNPDEKKVARLTGELYDLQEAFEKKAGDTGYRGYGMMHDGGYRGGHMMDW